MGTAEAEEKNVQDIVLSYSHLRPVLVHRRQRGFSSPHLTLRTLERDFNILHFL
jgi:hypothetical protein